MKNMIMIYLFLFLFLNSGGVFAEDQSSAAQTSCEKKTDITKLDPDVLKIDLPDLEEYFTCKAVIKGDIQICADLTVESPQNLNCKAAYFKYAAFAELFKQRRMVGELLTTCLEKFKSKGACDQFGRAMLSGTSEDCEHIDGITQEQKDSCKEMVSSDPSNPFGRKAVFMSALRKGGPAACDQLQHSSAAAICKGLLNKNVDGCQSNEGARRFKQFYCQQLSTKGSTNGTKKEK